jgi:hypothetical protein
MKAPAKTRTSRASRRGAAMLEGVIAMSSMVVFLGLISFTRGAYGEKLDQMSSTRRDALYFASNGCEGGAPPNTQTASDGTSPLTAGTEEADNVASKLRSSEQGGVDRSWNMARTTRSSQVGGNASVDRGGGRINLQRTPLTSDIETTSELACNERVYDNQWTALFSFAIDFAKSGAGAF